MVINCREIIIHIDEKNGRINCTKIHIIVDGEKLINCCIFTIQNMLLYFDSSKISIIITMQIKRLK